MDSDNGKRNARSISTRNQLMVQDAVSGMSNEDIAKKYGLNEPHTSKILNHSPEAINAHKLVEDRFKSLLDKAFDAIDRSLDGSDATLNVASTTAFKVIERIVGKVTEKTELTVSQTANMTEEEKMERLERILSEMKARKK